MKFKGCGSSVFQTPACMQSGAISRVLTQALEARKLSCFAMPGSRRSLETYTYIARLPEVSRHSSSRQQWPAACCSWLPGSQRMYLQEAAGATAAGDCGLQLAALDQPPGPTKSTPRPPQMMKKHVPCTDSSHKNVDEFLEHLKTLSWYSGQVGQKCYLLSGAAVTCGAQAALSRLVHAAPSPPL